jgi:flagellar hook protein FlgE
MSFNTALSGLQAASSDLQVTGNNIANASTTGFKSSRAEFGDVYAVSVLGSGSNSVGSGVLLADVAQQFSQGTVSFTDKSLDLAINGNGFFVTSDAGALSYTRAGNFGVNSQGVVVANNGARLQGNPVNNNQIVDGVLADIEISTTTQDPRQTAAVDIVFNLDANEDVLSERIRTTASGGVGTGVALPQANSSLNGYTAGNVDLVNATTGIVDRTLNIPSAPDLSAAQIAQQFNLEAGITANATTTVDIQMNSFPGSANSFIVNGNAVTGSTSAEIANNLNAIPGFSVAMDASTVPETIRITAQDGEDLEFAVAAGTNVSVTGVRIDPNTGAEMINALTPPMDGTVGPFSATVGGQVNLRIDAPLRLENASSNIFPAGNISQTYSVSNPFDPTDQDTYNHATSTTIYDSFGRPHIMTQYFVKDPVTSGGLANVWSMYVQVDNNDVGPDDFATGEPGRARYQLRFNSDGTLDTVNTDQIVIQNWDASVLDPSSEPLSPDQAQNPPLPQPPTSSNFVINIAGATQFGGQFAVTDLEQDGYGIGQLTRIEVADSGVVQARFTNGQTQLLGRVVLASFTNPQGLTPLGDTAWGESFESGAPIVGQAQTGNLGAIQSGALEDSNVDLSAELVNLIIAQRNFQANAKTIETENSVTQTIINLR